MYSLFGAALALLLLTSASVVGQPTIPVFIGPTINFLPPATDASGRTLVFGSTVTPQGGVQNTIDLYAGTKKLAGSVTSVGLTSDGTRAVFTDMVADGESVGIVDIATGTVRRLKTDTQGCIRPLALCINCFFACVVTPHATGDGGKILYAVRRNQPFYVVNADGTGLMQLPVFTGGLAPAPQRVISSNGQVVFTSSAPFGPTFAAMATDVYLMNLDGTNIRNLTNFGNNSSIYASNAVISADGSTVVFETNFAGKGAAADHTEIWAVQSDGGNLRQVTFGKNPATNPSLSADGKTGVFLRSGLISILQPFSPLQPPGLNISIGVLRYSVAQSPVISDDGRRVAFLIGPNDFSAGAVYQVNQDGSGLGAVYAPRAISPRGVVNTAGTATPPSPGGLVSAYGINFSGDSITMASGFPLAATLDGISMLAEGSQLPMLSVSPWQITAQLPQQAATVRTNFRIAFGDGSATPSEAAEVVASAPALFFTTTALGFSQAAAFHAGTAIPADDDHPAAAGEILEMYGSGLGATDPVVAAGEASPANPVARARVTPRVVIGNLDARVLFAGLTPGLAGVYQINIVVPSGLRAGRYGVVVQAAGQNASGSGAIAVK
jgi:uncharacterized protein (TIGR03437 family)